MARTNYSFTKRQKELERKNKQEKKRLRRLNKNAPQPEENAEPPQDKAGESWILREPGHETDHPDDADSKPLTGV